MVYLSFTSLCLSSLAFVILVYLLRCQCLRSAGSLKTSSKLHVELHIKSAFRNKQVDKGKGLRVLLPSKHGGTWLVKLMAPVLQAVCFFTAQAHFQRLRRLFQRLQTNSLKYPILTDKIVISGNFSVCTYSTPSLYVTLRSFHSSMAERSAYQILYQLHYQLADASSSCTVSLQFKGLGSYLKQRTQSVRDQNLKWICHSVYLLKTPMLTSASGQQMRRSSLQLLGIC